MVLRTVSSLVQSFWITSTSGTRCGGFQKCVPTTRSRCLSLRPISVEGMAELLLARMVVGAVTLSSSAKICCLSGSFSGAASNTKATSFIAAAIWSCAVMRRAAPVAVEQRARRLKPLRQRSAPLRRRIVDAHGVAGRRQQIGDAVAHQARADDADGAHPAVYPPSTYMTWPVQKSDAGVSR